MTQRTWRMRAVLGFSSRGGLGAISSSRCQTTRARAGRTRVGREILAILWTSGRASARSMRGAICATDYVQQRITSIDRRSGGARRDRTDDLLLAKQALSQLSYGPFRDQWSVIKIGR